MFERERHRRVATVLESLDADRLGACGCLFGGGTAAVLRWGEYRESIDIDFLVSDLDGYRALRQQARIALEAPAPEDRICGVTALTPLDMLATKLLANSDRWADDAVASRDLIDLAMMTPAKPLLRRAIAKAAGAYGDSIERDLRKAIDALALRRGRLDECMRALAMSGVSKAALWKRIQALGAATAKPRRRTERRT